MYFITYISFAGIFSLDFKREFKRCCCCLAARARQEEAASRVFRQTSIYRTTQTSLNCNLGNVTPANQRVPYTSCHRVACGLDDSAASDSGMEYTCGSTNGQYRQVEFEMKNRTLLTLP